MAKSVIFKYLKSTGDNQTTKCSLGRGCDDLVKNVLLYVLCRSKIQILNMLIAFKLREKSCTV